MVTRTPSPQLRSLTLRREGAVLYVDIDHPPMNLLDDDLVGQLHELVEYLERDQQTSVVVFASADPGYFLAHRDINDLLRRPAAAAQKTGGLKPFHQLIERYRFLPQVTIALIEGRARGGGSEFALALDMRFGSKQRAVLGQFEVGIGLLPGGGGTQHLPALVGRARALEIILSGADFDADVAEQYGWLNRALPDESLRPFVRSLAARMAQHPPQALRLAKQSVDASQPDRYEGLREEAGLFARLLSTDDAARLLRQFVADGGQTRAGELDIQPLLDRLGARPR